MRVTVSHNKPKQEIIQIVDRSFDEVFRGMGVVSLQIVNEKRSWAGSTMTFSFDAKMGFLSAPIKGTVDVTDKDVTIAADLGLFEKLLPARQAQAAVEGRIRGLIK
jgi:hypothetical protein